MQESVWLSLTIHPGLVQANTFSWCIPFTHWHTCFSLSTLAVAGSVNSMHVSGVSNRPPNGRHLTVYADYAKEGSTIIGSVILGSETPCFWIADAEALKTVTSDRHIFVKDVFNVRWFALPSLLRLTKPLVRAL